MYIYVPGIYLYTTCIYTHIYVHVYKYGCFLFILLLVSVHNDSVAGVWTVWGGCSDPLNCEGS